MSPIDPNDEMSGYSGCEYDPRDDFTQSLWISSWKKRDRSTDSQSSLPQPEDAEKGKMGPEKVKKSWKNSLLKWWKPERKSKPSSEAASSYSSGSLNQRKGHVSGPIHGSDRGAYIRRGGPASGPLANLSNSTKNKESETPYMCLNSGVKPYGPVYLVT